MSYGDWASNSEIKTTNKVVKKAAKYPIDFSMIDPTGVRLKLKEFVINIDEQICKLENQMPILTKQIFEYSKNLITLKYSWMNEPFIVHYNKLQGRLLGIPSMSQRVYKTIDWYFGKNGLTLTFPDPFADGSTNEEEELEPPSKKRKHTNSDSN
jgi:hypothetical protein